MIEREEVPVLMVVPRRYIDISQVCMLDLQELRLRKFQHWINKTCPSGGDSQVLLVNAQYSAIDHHKIPRHSVMMLNTATRKLRGVLKIIRAKQSNRLRQENSGRCENFQQNLELLTKSLVYSDVLKPGEVLADPRETRQMREPIGDVLEYEIPADPTMARGEEIADDPQQL